MNPQALDTIGAATCFAPRTPRPASTIASILEKKLHASGLHTYLLDGGNVRRGLNKDLAFTEAARVEDIRRIVEVARLTVDACLKS